MIKVPLKVTYGISAVLELAMHHGGAPIQARLIASRQTIPLRFIEQILQSLKLGGVVESVRGAQGGYSLSRPPSEITLADIVEAMNGFAGSEIRPKETNGHAGRPIHHEALLSTIWDRVHQAEWEVLHSVTLQSLLEQYNQLEQQRVPMYHI